MNIRSIVLPVGILVLLSSGGGACSEWDCGQNSVISFEETDTFNAPFEQFLNVQFK